LCYGKLNPEGWYKVPALLLEHGHRWLATTIGFLVLGMYYWQFAKFKPGLVEGVGIVLCSFGFLVLIYLGSLITAAFIAILGFAWLVLKWYSQRWPLLRGLTTLALLLVVLQASLGGLRVLKMSDPLGIIHGTLGQVFYCLLVFIAFVSSRAPGRQAGSLSASKPPRKHASGRSLCSSASSASSCLAPPCVTRSARTLPPVTF
jgi:heme A synthase